MAYFVTALYSYSLRSYGPVCIHGPGGRGGLSSVRPRVLRRDGALQCEAYRRRRAMPRAAGGMQLWSYIVMALYSYGPIVMAYIVHFEAHRRCRAVPRAAGGTHLWPYIVMALCSHGLYISLRGADAERCRAQQVECSHCHIKLWSYVVNGPIWSWPCIAVALYSYGVCSCGPI